MSNPFRLGFLTHFEASGDPRDVYRDTLELFIAADQLGFEVGWVAQHHFTPGKLPAPWPFLAAVAARTSRLRLGTAIALIAQEHPVRLAEDAAVVDTLSDGRVELGVGSGANPVEYRVFGKDVEQKRPLTTENLHTLQRTLRGEDLFEGGPRLQPAVPTLADRLWQSVYGVEGATYAARNGVGLLINRAVYDAEEPSDGLQVEWAKAYLNGWKELRHAAPPRIGLSRGIWPAADTPTALAELREELARVNARAAARPGRAPADWSFERELKRLNIIHGHPEEIAASLRSDRVVPHITDLILQFSPAAPPLDKAIWVLEQIATQIAPALGWNPVKDEAAPARERVLA